MRIRVIAGETALCIADGRAEEEEVDLALLPEAREGDEVLVFLGLARRRLEPEEAAQIRAALQALAALSSGANADETVLLNHGFADLIHREPQLPPHLEAARAAGLKEG